MRAADEICCTTGTYETTCPCRVRSIVVRGDLVPPCPRCHRDVDWSFVRPEPLHVETDVAVPPRDGT
jgi:hypothetical protein